MTTFPTCVATSRLRTSNPLSPVPWEILRTDIMTRVENAVAEVVSPTVVWNVGRSLHDERLDHNQTKSVLQQEKKRRVAAEQEAWEMKQKLISDVRWQSNLIDEMKVQRSLNDELQSQIVQANANIAELENKVSAKVRSSFQFTIPYSVSMFHAPT